MQNKENPSLDRSIAELDSLGEITAEVLPEVLRIAVDAIGALAGTLWFYHRFEDGLIRPWATQGGEKLEKIYILPGEGVAGMVIDGGEPILIADCKEDPRWTKKVDIETGFVTKSTVCVPLTVAGMVFGSIQLVNKSGGAYFVKEDLEILLDVASCISKKLAGNPLLGEYNNVCQPNLQLEMENETQRKFINRLGAYMDPIIIHEILRSDGKHKKSIEPQNAVILFADIRGFTGLAQNISPTQLISALSDFLAITSHQIHAYFGVVDKFMGDCTMAYWKCEGNPDAALSACRCAMAIQREAKAFTERLLRQTGIKVGIGIGLHIGPVLMCHVGDEQYMAYTVIGSSVNNACRIEEHAPADAVYISKDLADVLGGMCVTAPTQQEVVWRDKDDKLTVVELKEIK